MVPSSTHRPSLTCLAVLCLAAAACLAAETAPEPVAHWTFDRSNARRCEDLAGRGNHGKVFGSPTWTEGVSGLGLALDAEGDFVDCGDPRSLDITDAITIELWLKVMEIPAKGEPIVVGKGLNSAYGLTYYKDSVGPTGSRLYFYIGGENTATPIRLREWEHVAGVFDGKTMTLYVNGRPVGTRRTKAAGIPLGGNLFIGKGPLNAVIDEVRIFDRAVSGDFVRRSFELRKQRPILAGRPIQAAAKIECDAFTAEVGPKGALQLRVGKDRYLIESAFSYPDEQIGRNWLSEAEPSGDDRWKPNVTQPAPNRIAVIAEGRFYSLNRVLTVENGRISLDDALASAASGDVGVLIRHRVLADGPSREILLAGGPVSTVASCAPNPTALLLGAASGLGVLAEDTISRVQFEAAASRNVVSCSLNHLAMKPASTRTLRWALYAMPGHVDYFDFINRVRRDWKSNFRVEGPFDFTPGRSVWRDPVALKAYLHRKRLKIAAPGPWLDYDNFNNDTGKLVGRAEYKALLQEAREALKAADPEIKVVGNIEGPLVGVSLEVARVLYEALPENKRNAGYPIPFTDRQLDLIKDLPIRQKDSLVYGKGGRPFYELYFRGPPEGPRTPLMALLVYAAPGNGQLDFLMDQARFLMEEVGLDGVYLDGGGPVRGARYGYDTWDGFTVDIDRATGRITRRMTDYLPVIGDVPCRTLFDYVLSRGGVFVANGHHYSREMQSYRIPRFLETGGEYDPLGFPDGREPPLLPLFGRGQLDAPIALGQHPPNMNKRGLDNYAKCIMKGVMTHLRHGLLYYPYSIEIPEIGPGAGEYGPINHMFPITPIELHEGWILGKERIITAKSIDVLWEKPGEPLLHVFDLKGRRVPAPKPQFAGKDGKWRVKVDIDDWKQIAVVE